MRKPTQKTENIQLIIKELEFREARFNAVGTSPLIMNRFQQKAWQELLFPAEQKNRATLEQTLKHDPISEFRGSTYRNRDPSRPTLFHMPNGAFHGAIAQAAVDIPGAARAQIERLTRVASVDIDLYGVPKIFSCMVRNSGMNRSPDVRTRSIFPQWACQFVVRYMATVITEKALAALVGGAGMIVGIGDWRGEKGGAFGSWRLAQDKDPEFAAIRKQQGREPQRMAYEAPDYYDEDTQEMLEWFEQELRRREMEGSLTRSTGLEPEGGRAAILRAAAEGKRRAAKRKGNGQRKPPEEPEMANV